ncbi:MULTISPECIES: hypothetical protein [unclassified Kitasatospora]|uniref:hypothetical protein n=1 Tax=unclassified Kitasatospora TaxID=2633591 RepID=UPI00070FEDA5|nr:MULTISPECIES: hypothetical protein [unclassified Kitasatospora]KQV14539.1 hypothetical protein ASC99_30725 [Kitasatospora sp. Root107]KRB68078.1 hypothetical protein ASE03_29445 [Kitasatospora sp. Root187]
MAKVESGAFSDVPLTGLFRDLATVDVERMRQAARSVDSVRPAGKRPPWDWFMEHAASPAPLPSAATGAMVVLLTAVGLYDGSSDWLELELDVSWTCDGLSVTAAVSVACWCDVNHNTHYIDPVDLKVVDGASLAASFEAAAGRVLSWTKRPHDPSFWRARAGLPQPPLH